MTGRLYEALQPAGLGVTLRLENAPQLAEALRAAMPGWPLASWPTREAGARALSARFDHGVYHLPQPGHRSPGVATAACGLIADLIPLALEQWPDTVGLHCAAVEVEGRLVVFPATHRAGKSLLAAAFAAAGLRVFADDVLLLTPDGEGRALGIAPRLRRPLPSRLPGAVARFILDHQVVRDRRYRYVDPGPERLAAHGEQRPLGAIVLLERWPGAGPNLMPLSPGESLLRLLSQSLAGRDHHPDTLLRRLLPIMPGLSCRLLCYDDPMPAVERILAGGLDAPAAVVDATESPVHGRPAASGRRWRRRPVEAEYLLQDELFLVDDRGRIHRLTPVAAGIWRLLGVEALSRDQVVALLAIRFPQIERAHLAADVAAFLEEAWRMALVAPCAP